MKVNVYVGLKSGVLDPQGDAVASALKQQGFNDLKSVRIGRWITLEVDAKNTDVAEARAKEMCDALLANQVIETYTIEAAA